MACGSCDGQNPNLRHNCENPCHTSITNTATCESLPSQIQNFTTQFFGIVTKTEINGQVTWSLPCSLDVGLPANPRLEGEGLACYFLRLFADGIIGLTGPRGVPGEPGANGNNAYSVTLHGFTQPTIGNPNIQVSTAFNPAILTNSYVFIQTSGYYLVTNADNSGALFLQLVQAVPGASGTITAGKLVTTSGPPGPQGNSVTGPPGPKGDTGPAGEIVTHTNGYYFSTTGSNFDLPAVYAAVNFTTSSPALLLPAAGTYVMTAVVTVAGLGGVTTADAAIVKLRNTSTGIDVPGSEQNITYLSPTQYSQITINALVTTTGANQTVALFGKASGAGIITAVALNTTVTFVRLS